MSVRGLVLTILLPAYGTTQNQMLSAWNISPVVTGVSMICIFRVEPPEWAMYSTVSICHEGDKTAAELPCRRTSTSARDVLRTRASQGDADYGTTRIATLSVWKTSAATTGTSSSTWKSKVDPAAAET